MKAAVFFRPLLASSSVLSLQAKKVLPRHLLLISCKSRRSCLDVSHCSHAVVRHSFCPTIFKCCCTHIIKLKMCPLNAYEDPRQQAKPCRPPMRCCIFYFLYVMARNISSRILLDNSSGCAIHVLKVLQHTSVHIFAAAFPAERSSVKVFHISKACCKCLMRRLDKAFSKIVCLVLFAAALHAPFYMTFNLSIVKLCLPSIGTALRGKLPRVRLTCLGLNINSKKLTLESDLMNLLSIAEGSISSDSKALLGFCY